MDTIFYIYDGEEYQLSVPNYVDTSNLSDSRIILDLIAQDLWHNYDGWEWMVGEDVEVEVYLDKDLNNLFVSGVINTDMKPVFSAHITNH